MEQTRILLIFITLCFTTLSLASREDSMVETIPAYTIALKADILNSTNCQTHLQEFRQAVDKRLLWSLTMMDASGKTRSGFLDGNNYWLGSRYQCSDLSAKKDIPMAERLTQNYSRYNNRELEFPPFKLHYYVAFFKHNSTIQKHVEIGGEDVMSLGLCMPASCSKDDISIVLERIFRDRTLLFGDLYLADFKLVEVKDLKNDYTWLLESRFIVIGFFIIASTLMVIAGTAYDVLVHQKRLKAKQKLLACENNNTTEGKLDSEGNQYTKCEMPTRLQQVLMCFSLYTNTQQIFNTDLAVESIPEIHGLRFCGMAWIILVHTYFYALDFAENRLWEFRTTKEFLLQIVGNATYSVDTFFFLSGFLLSYLFFKDLKKRKNNKPLTLKGKFNLFFVALVKRFIRLSPAYMMLVGITQLNWSFYDKTAVFNMNEKPHEQCAKYWWRNFLYINNLFSRETMCLSWSWYLSNDMQFFILGTILLLLSTTHFYTSVSILLSLLVGSCIVTGYVSYSYNYIPTLDELYRLLHVLYDPPWVRIGPYIIGMMMGYVILKINSKLILGKTTLALCWCFGASCNLIVLFATYTDMSLYTATVYTGLSRTLWGIGIAWIILACCTNNAGILHKILSFKAWIPLSKLTYCAYLVNPLVISTVYLHGESSIHFNILQGCAQFLGMIVGSFLAAYVLTLFTEIPCVLLMRIYLGSRTKNT